MLYPQLDFLHGLRSALLTILPLLRRRLNVKKLCYPVLKCLCDGTYFGFRAVESDCVSDHEIYVCLERIDRLVFVCV